MDAAPDVARVLRSPVFSQFAFPRRPHAVWRRHAARHVSQGRGLAHAARQAGGEAGEDHRAGRLRLRAHVEEDRRRRSPLWIVEFLQKELFKQVPKQDGKLVIAVTHNTTYYADWRRDRVLLLGNTRRRLRHRKFVRARLVSARRARRRRRRRRAAADAATRASSSTIRCTIRWSTAAQRQASGQHVPGLDAARAMRRRGVRRHGRRLAPISCSNPPTRIPRTTFPRRRPSSRRPAATYHLQNVALLPWYTGAAEGLGSTYSFPDPQALAEPAKPCPARGGRGARRRRRSPRSRPFRASGAPTATS